ncbi:fructosamine kinase family protein [bacterium]|nr:fructosamine kinase family protein [bacterium]
MGERLNGALEAAIERATGRPARIACSAPVGGGCINDARRVELSDGRVYFVKSNSDPLPGMFEREAEGLAALAAVGAIRVPVPVCTGGGDGVTPFIVMEYIETGAHGPCFFEDFGRRFAELHKKSAGERFGFAHDNYLGNTPQENAWCDDWVEFWRERRFGFQLRLGRTRRQFDASLERLLVRLMDRLPEYIGQPDEPACLLHGDLWGGNYLSDSSGRPVLIDPAVYYGRREADLAMTLLFGGFDRRFYAAYQEVWPLADGSEARLDIYKLYHLLNHLNIFGGSYRSGCMAILSRYA